MPKSIEKLQKLVYEEYVVNGYEARWKSCGDGDLADIAEIGLIGTEVTEAIEAVRLQREFLAEELADIIIRTMNFATRKGIFNLSDVIVQKHQKNMKRGKLHGKRV